MDIVKRRKGSNDKAIISVIIGTTRNLSISSWSTNGMGTLLNQCLWLDTGSWDAKRYKRFF